MENIVPQNNGINTNLQNMAEEYFGADEYYGHSAGDAEVTRFELRHTIDSKISRLLAEYKKAVSMVDGRKKLADSCRYC